MDLWVRSQDKENLLKIDRLDINDNTIMANMKKHYSGCDYIILGEYNSSIRTFEVLDEIQERITILNLMSTINGEKEMIKIAHAFGEDKINGVLKPYQMPKE
jgi:hypothetical protein